MGHMGSLEAGWGVQGHRAGSWLRVHKETLKQTADLECTIAGNKWLAGTPNKSYKCWDTDS